MKIDDPHRIRPRGILLRDALILALDANGGRPVRRTDVESFLSSRGLGLPTGRPGKAISDAFTTEVRRGRVRRLGDGAHELARPLTPSERHRSRRRMANAVAGRPLAHHLGVPLV